MTEMPVQRTLFEMALETLLKSRGSGLLGRLEADVAASENQWNSFSPEPIDWAEQFTIYRDFKADSARAISGNNVATSLNRSSAILSAIRERLTELAQSAAPLRAGVVADLLVAALISADVTRWQVAHSLAMAQLYRADVPGLLLLQSSDRLYANVTDPLLRACESAVSGGATSELAATLRGRAEKIKYEVDFYNGLVSNVRRGALLSKTVILVLDTAIQVVLIYELATTLARNFPGPPAAGGGLLVSGSGVLAVQRGLVLEWSAVMEGLTVLGGLGILIAMSSREAAATAAGPKSPLGQAEREDKSPGIPSGPPRPAPPNLLEGPNTPEALARHAAKEEARFAVERAFRQKLPFSSLDIRLRQRFGQWLMDQIYPMVVRIQSGLGEVYYSGRLDKQFINRIRRPGSSAVFIEPWVSGRGIASTKSGFVRLDLLRIRFGTGVQGDFAEIVDIATSFRRPHLRGTGGYVPVVNSTLGLRVKAASDLVFVEGDRVIGSLIDFSALP